MKRILFPILFFVLIFTSCSLFFQEEYGTIKIDLEGGKARSINSSTGLPNLADSELEIDIVTDGNSSIYKKILTSEPKFFQADFPIGSRLEITVKLNGPSASWSAHNSLTVKEGNNDIRLLLNKNASSLANVGFSTTATTNTYEFNIAGKKIDINSSEQPVFTRDSRGRLYIAYKNGTWALNRYESDGTPNNFAGSLPSTITYASSVNLASDPITGKVYVAADSNLYRIKDDGAVTPTGGTAIPAGPIAVYNNNLFVLGVSAVSGNNPLKMFTITEEGSVLTLNQAGSTSVSTGQITISTSGSETTINVDFKDILVKKDKIYILFAKNNLPTPSTPSPYYSLGGMLEYTYNSSGVIDNPQKYGFNDTVTAGDDIVTAGEANFYGPACFIGYDEQSISIADDGCTFKKEGGSVRIYKNVNRIFSFNTSTKSLYSYATENKWFKEYEVTGGSTPSPGTGKVLLWQKNNNPNLGMEYYQVNEGRYTGLPTAFIEGVNSSALSQYKQIPTDVFSYDNLGNLYVVWKIEGSPTHKYVVRRYLWNGSTASYTYEKEANLYFKNGANTLNIYPDAIAVNISETNKYLYYTYKQNANIFLLRLNWNDNFSAASKDPSFEQKIKDAGGSKSFCTALAVNENGIFAAVKNIAGTDINYPDNYSVNIKKYKHTNSADGETLANNIVPQIDADNYTLEDICDLQIKGGVLYGIKTKKTGKLKKGTTSKVSTSGELFKIEALDSSFSSLTVVTSLWSSSSPTDGYAPYRFIGTDSNKLIIASDGYYGDTSNAGDKAQNKNKVLSFVIGSWTLTSTDTNAKFSRELTYGASGFEWK
ncbi:hypothetical protein [Treponema denticola]|uniref:hypothetical protein n=1 Tax=Treponema denticola TaxID=158 RepID=UPI0002B58767|nr:hypothetical protein [Treponema denticola]EMB21116.1 hypothetical protein HMPREF9724_02253 [Treponema denticola SP37]EPF33146.1 hypothetical protein HMPREF9734_02473 [Treponema denticola SP44]EPF40624.1 hypothetical protein HMPREF9731_00490 [Treponema denticola SP23]